MRLTHLSDRQLAEFAWSKPERMRYQGANGDEIEAWIMRPIGAREGVRCLIAVRIQVVDINPPSGAGINPYHQYLLAAARSPSFTATHMEARAVDWRFCVK